MHRVPNLMHFKAVEFLPFLRCHRNDLGISLTGLSNFLEVCAFISITGNVYLVVSMFFVSYFICSSGQASKGENAAFLFYRKRK